MPNQALQQWVDQVAAQTTPESIHWCDGTDEEIGQLYEMMVDDGTLVGILSLVDYVRVFVDRLEAEELSLA